MKSMFGCYIYLFQLSHRGLLTWLMFSCCTPALSFVDIVEQINDLIELCACCWFRRNRNNDCWRQTMLLFSFIASHAIRSVGQDRELKLWNVKRGELASEVARRINKICLDGCTARLALHNSRGEEFSRFLQRGNQFPRVSLDHCISRRQCLSIHLATAVSVPWREVSTSAEQQSALVSLISKQRRNFHLFASLRAAVCLCVPHVREITDSSTYDEAASTEPRQNEIITNTRMAFHTPLQY